MPMKYDTRAEALSAVKKSGKNLELTTLALRDDEEIVRTAIEHGGSIEHASFRLRNSPELLLLYARSGVVEHVFERALFCAKMDVSLVDPYCRLFMRNREFNLELKLAHGAYFRSSFSEYNSMSRNHLLEELRNIRQNQIAFFRRAFKKTVIDKMYEIEESDDLRFSLIRIPALSIHHHHGSFSQVKESFATNIRLNEREKDYFCSERGSGSFPERVMKSLLDQLGVDYAREKVFEWSAGTGNNSRMGQKRYDFYIPATSTIIEVHGAQHYDGGFENLGGRTLSEEQENDRFKAELAKENGIKNYIVVNAVSSDFKFLRNSISTNAEFTRCFNLKDIDWNIVHDSAIGKKETDQVFPYFGFCQTLYQTWYNLIEETETPEDYKFVPRTYGSGHEDTQELRDNVATTFPSTHGLYPHELMVLRYAPKYTYPVDSNDYSAKIFYDNYGIGDVKPYFDKLIDEEFLSISDTRTILQKATVPTIKKLLADAGHAVKGKKDELIQYILNNISEDIINNAFPQKYYMLTAKGTSELEESQYLTEGAYMGLSVWTMNRFVHAFPYERVHDLLREFHDRPRRFYPYLTQKEKDALGPRYAQTIPVPSRANRPSAIPEAQTVKPTPIKKTIPVVNPQPKVEVLPPVSQDKNVDFSRRNEATENSTEKLVQKSTVQEMMKPEETVANVESPEVGIQHTILPSSEHIHLEEPAAREHFAMESSTASEKRDSLPVAEAIPSEAPQTTCDTEASETTVIIKTPLNAGAKSTKHVSEILSSKEAERILISNTAKPIKTRKIYVILMVPFMLLTALAISMMLSDIHMLSVVCFLGIPTAMFAVLSRSPKYTKYILGRDKGIKKGLFVVLCLIAMIVVPVIVSILMN